MLRYIVRRLLLAIPTVFGGMTLIFFGINVVPGDPATLVLGDYYTQESYDALAKTMGLDQPLYVRYAHFLADVARGDFGTSLLTGQSVVDAIRAHFPHTLTLALASIVVALLVGISIGILSATTRNRWPDQLSMLFALLSISTPSFVLAVILILVFSVRLGWLPTIGAGDFSEPLGLLKYLILPVLALSMRSVALIARLTRSTMLEVMNRDYIRTARAKGLHERAVISRHVLRNAMLPLITVIGLDLGALLSGSLVIEVVFNRPGMGRLLVDSVVTRDYPMVQGVMIFFMIIILLSNLLADIGYGIADPRIRFD